MNGIHEVTGSIPVWSTKFPNPRKRMQARRLSGSIYGVGWGFQGFRINELEVVDQTGIEPVTS